MPGATFHLTARLHDQEPLFEPDLKTAMVGFIREHVAVRNVQLFAYAIMSNHLHLVVRQGDAPLVELMQPLLRRVALLVQRRHSKSGYVFGQRYRHRICGDAEYLRSAIVYTHLNPVRAGLCDRPEDYEWSSHASWISRGHGADDGAGPIDIESILPLFAGGPDRTRDQLIADYLTFVAWRQSLDRWRQQLQAPGVHVCSPPPPPVTQGDFFWRCNLLPRTLRLPDFAVTGEPVVSDVGSTRPDLATIARTVVSASPSPLEFPVVRSRWGGPEYAAVRRRIVRHARMCGYRSAQIARFLRVSNSMVANVVAEDRKRLLLSG